MCASCTRAAWDPCLPTCPSTSCTSGSGKRPLLEHVVSDAEAGMSSPAVAPSHPNSRAIRVTLFACMSRTGWPCGLYSQDGIRAEEFKYLLGPVVG